MKKRSLLVPLFFFCCLALSAQNSTYRVTSILQIMDIKTGKITVVKEFDYRVEAPNWTKDGKSLIYNSNGSMYKIPVEGGEPVRIETGSVNECNNDHVISPDGSMLAVSGSTEELSGSRIFLLPFEGGEPTLIVEKSLSYLHGWSPDGSTFCYCGERDGNYDVYTMSVNGGEEKRLTTPELLDDGPEYSPNGKYIWFCSVRTGLMQIWRMLPDGSDQRQITFDEDYNHWFPHVSPNGKWVVCLAYHKGDIEPGEHLSYKNVVLRMMTTKGRKLRTIHSLFGGQGTFNVNSWAPDSRHFAFVSYRFESESK